MCPFLPEKMVAKIKSCLLLISFSSILSICVSAICIYLYIPVDSSIFVVSLFYHFVLNSYSYVINQLIISALPNGNRIIASHQPYLAHLCFNSSLLFQNECMENKGTESDRKNGDTMDAGSMYIMYIPIYVKHLAIDRWWQFINHKASHCLVDIY